jgi:hypothetical protein
LHVVRRHHHDLVARLDEVQEDEKVGFGSAVGDLHVIGRRSRIESRDRAPQLYRAIGLRIAQCQRHQRRM